MLKSIREAIRQLTHRHFFGAFFIVIFSSVVISEQISDRSTFASSELYSDVSERWGAPIDQPAPTARYVVSGGVFQSLESLPLAAQEVRIDAAMSYRKRGLVSFSGFEFTFKGDFEAKNPEPRPIDLVFVFPVSLEKNRVLLQDLSFTVDGHPASTNLLGKDALVWTGRVEPGKSAKFKIAFRGRGLSSFTYRLDPALPARNVLFTMAIEGGDNHDYPPNVVPPSSVHLTENLRTLHWGFESLESGIALGVVLPEEKAYDRLIRIILRRSWAPFLVFFFGLSLLVGWLGTRPLESFETYLFAAAYATFPLLLAYLTAFIPFPLAYVLSLAIAGSLVLSYAKRVISIDASTSPTVLKTVGILLVSTLFVPNLAVVLEGYTGLIYTLEIIGAIVFLMHLTSRAAFRKFLNRVSSELG